MTAEEFRFLAFKLFGPDYGWQTRCAEALGTHRSNVSRWLAGSAPVSGPAAAAMLCWEASFKRDGTRP